MIDGWGFGIDGVDCYVVCLVDGWIHISIGILEWKRFCFTYMCGETKGEKERVCIKTRILGKRSFLSLRCFQNWLEILCSPSPLHIEVLFPFRSLSPLFIAVVVFPAFKLVTKRNFFS